MMSTAEHTTASMSSRIEPHHHDQSGHHHHVMSADWASRDDVPYNMFHKRNRRALEVAMPSPDLLVHARLAAQEAAATINGTVPANPQEPAATTIPAVGRVLFADCLRTCGPASNPRGLQTHCPAWVATGVCSAGAACPFVHVAWLHRVRDRTSYAAGDEREDNGGKHNVRRDSQAQSDPSSSTTALVTAGRSLVTGTVSQPKTPVDDPVKVPSSSHDEHGHQNQAPWHDRRSIDIDSSQPVQVTIACRSARISVATARRSLGLSYCHDPYGAVPLPPRRDPLSL